MVSLIAAPTQFRLSRPSFLPVNSSAVFVVSLATRQVLPGSKQNQAALKRESPFYGVVHSCGVVRRCKRSENEDYSVLEQEVLEFMLQSDDPDKFPSRRELIEAGRRDLAEAVVKRGGWMTRGWDLVSDDESEKDELDAVLTKWNSISAKMGEDQEKSVLESNGVHSSELSSAELKIPEISFAEAKRLECSSAELRSVNGYSASLDSSHPSASSSGRSVETAADGDVGIEGILNRLEKQRNLSLGFHVERKGNTVCSNENGRHTGVLDTADSCYPPKDGEATLSPENNTVAIQEKLLDDSRRVNNINSMPKLNGLRSSLKPDTWRTWSIQRAGFSDGDFEAAEINFDHSGKGRVPDTPADQTIALKKGNNEELSEMIKDLKSGRAPDSPTDQIIALKKGNKEEPSEIIEDLNSGGKYNGDKIRSRLHNLEHELSSALRLLRSNTDDSSQKVDRERLSEDFRNLSDAWEFRENEIMNAQDKLRSLRARLIVLEGKVALTKIDTQKVKDEKQKKLNDARKALQLLRTTCIIWPNSASEVLLTGSFDGWATQRKMEKSSTGIFSLLLRLYPGRYEIKFIVDGVWKVDPLRPIVNNNGFENNLLIIS